MSILKRLYLKILKLSYNPNGSMADSHKHYIKIVNKSNDRIRNKYPNS